MSCMVERAKNNGKPEIVRWYGRVFLTIGTIIGILGFLASILNYFVEGNFLVNFFVGLEGLWTFGVFLVSYGIAVINGKRWHIFGLLILVFFGSFVIGLFSMVGKETNVGFYIWAIGGLISLSLILILYIYWDVLVDG